MRSLACFLDLAGDRRIEIRYIWRAETGSEIPTRNSRIEQIISTCHIIVSIHVVVAVIGQVEQLQ